MNKKLFKIVLIVGALLLILATAFDQRLKIVHYEIQNEKSDSEIRIAFVSDLHSCKYGENMSVLIENIRAHRKYPCSKSGYGAFRWGYFR